MPTDLTAKYGVCDEDIDELTAALETALRHAETLVSIATHQPPRRRADRVKAAEALAKVYGWMRAFRRAWLSALQAEHSPVFNGRGERFEFGGVHSPSMHHAAGVICTNIEDALLMGVWPDDLDARFTSGLSPASLANVNEQRAKAGAPPLPKSELTPETIAPRLEAIRKLFVRVKIDKIDFGEIIARLANESGRVRAETRTREQHFARIVTAARVQLPTTPPSAPPSAPGPTIWFHAERSYSHDGSTQRLVNEGEDSILRTFLEHPHAMDTAMIEEKSGVPADQVAPIIGRLQKKFGGVFGAAIRTPGGKDGGGYLIRVRKAGC